MKKILTILAVLFTLGLSAQTVGDSLATIAVDTNLVEKVLSPVDSSLICYRIKFSMPTDKDFFNCLKDNSELDSRFDSLPSGRLTGIVSRDSTISYFIEVLSGSTCGTDESNPFADPDF